MLLFLHPEKILSQQNLFIFPKMYYHKALHHPEGSRVSVTATSQVRVSAMFRLLILGN
jgi:hypothetical protein